jgi:hypothetical protein
LTTANRGEGSEARIITDCIVCSAAANRDANSSPDCRGVSGIVSHAATTAAASARWFTRPRATAAAAAANDKNLNGIAKRHC